MSTIPPPTIVAPREEWADTDFDFPDEEPIHASDAESDKEDVEDWDIEMDLGKTGGAKVQTVLDGMAAKSGASDKYPRMFTIRPPLASSVTEEDEDDEDEGVSTIKLTELPKVSAVKPAPDIIEEDFEDAFALPLDLTQLSLRPLPLSHRASKASIEWGDKDHTLSSQSSDAFSTLGFAENSPSSNYTSASSSLPETETEDDDEEGDMLDGLVVPTGLFDSGHGAKKLVKLLETKKKTAFTDMRVKVASPDPEDDFEMGLVLDDNMELSPSRLLQNAQQSKRSAPPSIRSKSAPARPSIIRPPSRLRSESRAKSPTNPPISSASQLRKFTRPPSPSRPSPAARSQTYSQALAANPSALGSTFLAPKAGSLRIQKSHTGLKPASPPMTRRLTRKASLPSLSDNAPQPSGSGSSAAPQARYDAPTASSRAKKHTSSTSRMHTVDNNVPPTRPSTPTSNPVALRLTMPTSSSRLKARTPISALFPVSATATNAPPLPRSTSPLPNPPRPPSSASNHPPPATSAKPRHGQTQSLPHIPAVKVLKRPKRTRMYGDGTELDEFEDLPLDPQKEGRYHVQPKGPASRVPSVTQAAIKGDTVIPDNKGSLRRVKKRELSGDSAELPKMAPTKTLKRTSRIDLSAHTKQDVTHVKKNLTSSNSGQSRRKPTLIRNLGGSNAPKVVGDMKWNPQTQRWEGNDQVLKDFDAALGSSTRPALITHLTGSSMGSPINGLASGARVVGNMIFDPTRMCWISTLPPEEEEPDVFAELADDEEDDDWDVRGGTIRASQQQGSGQNGPESSRVEPPSPARSHSRSMSETESDRGSRASMVYDVEDGFLDKCRVAEERHRSEMRGWIFPRNRSSEPDRSYLYEIRALATRQY